MWSQKTLAGKLSRQGLLAVSSVYFLTLLCYCHGISASSLTQVCLTMEYYIELKGFETAPS